MDNITTSKIISFIWGITDDVFRDHFRRGKYHHAILPVCVIRRLDPILESTEVKLLETKPIKQEIKLGTDLREFRFAAGDYWRIRHAA